MPKVTDQEAREYHHLNGKPGKIAVIPTKPMDTQRDLSLAYTPGVAVPVLDIEKDPEAAYEYTSKGNLVAVLTNGTAILGLGDRGALASKPVMEGKGVLFKRFADVDVFDIEVDSHDPDEVIMVAKAIAPTFGGINLEDIKAPECFYIETELKKRMKIPVFFSASFIRSRSPRSAPFVLTLVGSTAITATFLPSSWRLTASLPIRVLFPAPGGPVTPTTCALWARGNSFRSSR